MINLKNKFSKKNLERIIVYIFLDLIMFTIFSYICQSFYIIFTKNNVFWTMTRINNTNFFFKFFPYIKELVLIVLFFSIIGYDYYFNKMKNSKKILTIFSIIVLIGLLLLLLSNNFAIGYTPRWTVGVWVGNFDASPMQKVSGITGAGPILHDVAVAVQARYPSTNFMEPKGIKHIAVCSETGLLAGPKCSHTHEEVFDQVHLPVRCNGQHKLTVSAVQITSPTAGDIFYVDPATPRATQQLKLAATCAQNACRWKLDGKPLPGTSCETWWPLAGGKHSLSVTCGGQTDTLSFEVVE